MSTSEAQKAATIAYMKRRGLVEIRFRVDKEDKDKIYMQASAHGKSVRRYLLDLIEKDMAENPMPTNVENASVQPGENMQHTSNSTE